MAGVVAAGTLALPLFEGTTPGVVLGVVLGVVEVVGGIDGVVEVVAGTPGVEAEGNCLATIVTSKNGKADSSLAALGICSNSDAS